MAYGGFSGMSSDTTCTALRGRSKGAGMDGLAGQEKLLLCTTRPRDLCLNYTTYPARARALSALDLDRAWLNNARDRGSNAAPAFCALSASESEANCPLDQAVSVARPRTASPCARLSNHSNTAVCTLGCAPTNWANPMTSSLVWLDALFP
jgi:hypothetical protein